MHPSLCGRFYTFRASRHRQKDQELQGLRVLNYGEGLASDDLTDKGATKKALGTPSIAL